MVNCLHCKNRLTPSVLNHDGMRIPVYACENCKSVYDQKSIHEFASDYGATFGDQEVKERKEFEPICPHCGRNIFKGGKS